MPQFVRRARVVLASLLVVLSSPAAWAGGGGATDPPPPPPPADWWTLKITAPGMDGNIATNVGFAVTGTRAFRRGAKPITSVVVSVWRGDTLFGSDDATMYPNQVNNADPTKNPKGEFSGSLTSPTTVGGAVVIANGCFKTIPIDQAHDAVPVDIIAQ